MSESAGISDVSSLLATARQSGTDGIDSLTRALHSRSAGDDVQQERLLVVLLSLLNACLGQLWRMDGKITAMESALALLSRLIDVARALRNNIRSGRKGSSGWWMRRVHAALSGALPRMQARVLAFVEIETHRRAVTIVTRELNAGAPNPLTKSPTSVAVAADPSQACQQVVLQLLTPIQLGAHGSLAPASAMPAQVCAFAACGAVRALLDAFLRLSLPISLPTVAALYAEELYLRQWLVSATGGYKATGDIGHSSLLWLQRLRDPWARAEAVVRLLSAVHAGVALPGVLPSSEEAKWVRLANKGFGLRFGLACCIGTQIGRASQVGPEMSLSIDDL